MKNTITTLALAALAGTAVAQPAAFTDLGDRTTTQNFTQAVTLTAPNDIQWFRIVLPAVNAVGGGFVDIWTNLTGDITDSEIGLYEADGDFATGVAGTSSDDDSGAGLASQLTYGSTIARPTIGTGLARNGSDGSLAGGEYYVAVGRFSVTFATGFGVVSTNALAQSTTELQFDIASSTDPFPPSGTGAAAPGTAIEGQSVLLTVAVVPGGNPASTGITVVGDVSGFGGSATQAFSDSGTNGDVTAGDNIFSYTVTIPVGTTNGTAFSVAWTAADDQSRSANGTINVTGNSAPDWDETVNGGGDAGQETSTAQVVTGTGTSLDVIAGFLDTSDVDIYRINICDTANFSATTVGGATIDTQLFLFNLDGVGVTFNDDATGLQSTISGQFVPATGEYYLAVSHYDIDPADADGGFMWIDTPFGTERQPDGPSAANSFTQWLGTNATVDTGAYRINLTGACFSSGGGGCGPADIGGAGGAPGADGVLDNNDFIVYIDNFFNQTTSADIGAAGGVAGSDGLYDNNDFIVFIDQFFNGNC